MVTLHVLKRYRFLCYINVYNWNSLLISHYTEMLLRLRTSDSGKRKKGVLVLSYHSLGEKGGDLERAHSNPPCVCFLPPVFGSLENLCQSQ